MLRVFGLYLPIPPLLLAITETVVLTIALSAAVGSGVSSSPDVGATHFSFACLLSFAVIVAMLGAGLYSSAAFVDHRLALVRVVISLGLVAPPVFIICTLFELLSDTQGQLGANWPFKAGVAWLICIGVTRTLFAHFSN